jgi:uncharacterized protein (TIGR00369 family)
MLAAMSKPTAKPPADSEVTLQHFMMPEHANPLGNVHGGVIMKLVDEAAAICSMRHSQRPTVTVAIDSVSFRSPVHVGELVSLHARLNYVGRTSMEVGVEVLAENPIAGSVTHTNSAYVVLVALGDDGKPCGAPALLVSSDDEKQRWAAGEQRQKERVARRR